MLADAEQARQRAEVNKAQAVLTMIDTWPIPDALNDTRREAVDSGARVGDSSP
ncbi:MAG: hypothetical protein LKI24_16485 [Acidipropionibacterium sp.]|nr:hypothetical protein [Acidipropionibacterium sp.]